MTILTHPLTKEELEELLPLPTTGGGGGGMTDAEFTAHLPLPVTGPLTDAQLRATPVPVDTELPAAAALANGMANPVTSQVGSNLLIWNGVTWDRLRDTFSNGEHSPAGSGYVPTVNFNHVYDNVQWVRHRGSIGGGALMEKRAADFNVTVSGAANAIATATLVAAGGTTFHYITHIFIKRVATAALAGGALLTVTTTNLFGRTWRTGNQMSITVATQEGTVLRDQEFSHPLRSQSPNTNTTIVCPAAGAAVSWHMSIDYFIR